MEPPTIPQLRSTLDVYDKLLMDLLRRRSLVVRDIHRLKDAAGDAPVDPAREAEILAARTGDNNKTLYSDDTVAAIFRTVFGAARETLGE